MTAQEPARKKLAPGNRSGASGAENALNAWVISTGAMMAVSPIRLDRAPCSSPCCSAGSVRDSSPRRAGMTNPMNAPTAMQGNTIQPAFAKA